MRHLHLDPKRGQALSGFSRTSSFCLSAPCYYQPVGNHSTLSSWLSGAACCGSALYQTSASKPCSPERQEDVFRAAGGLATSRGSCARHAARVIPVCHTVPSARSEELQVNRAAAFLWLGRWLNNFSLKKLCAITTVTQRHPRRKNMGGVSQGPWPTGTAHSWKLCWGAETSPLAAQNLQ